MKRLASIVVSLGLLALLAGCSSKTFLQIDFDAYTVQRDTNGKSYAEVAIPDGSPLRYQTQQITTGTANSLIVLQMPVDQWVSLSGVVALNDSQLSQKLLHYQSIDQDPQDIVCGEKYLSGYTTVFSYDIDAEHTFYSYQYYFLDAGALYLISFQSDHQKDIEATVKSMKKLSCK